MAMTIHEWICETLDKKLREGHAGSRERRACANHIFVLRNLFKQPEEWRRQLVVNFIDFRNSFDFLHRPTMWNILKSFGSTLKVMDMIKLLYDGSTSLVRMGLKSPLVLDNEK